MTGEFARGPGATGAERAGTTWSWEIGRLFGIDIFVHATFLLLLLWVGLTHLLQGGVRAALDGLGLILAVFATVVLHELSHALTARRFGIRTRDGSSSCPWWGLEPGANAREAGSGAAGRARRSVHESGGRSCPLRHRPRHRRPAGASRASQVVGRLFLTKL